MPAEGPLSAHGPALFHMKDFLFITSFNSLEQRQAQEDGARGLCKLMSDQIKHVLSASNLFQLRPGDLEVGSPCPMGQRP